MNRRSPPALAAAPLVALLAAAPSIHPPAPPPPHPVAASPRVQESLVASPSRQARLTPGAPLADRVPPLGRPRPQLPRGAALADSLGCGGCHAGLSGAATIRALAPPFGDDAAPLAPAFIFHYLADPQRIRPEIAPARMPRYDLDEAERVALALFVANDRELRGVDDALRTAMERHPDAGPAVGRSLFEALNCAGCHIHPGIEPQSPAPDLGLVRLRLQREWLTRYLAAPVPIRPAGVTPGRGERMPDFALSATEVAALADFLLADRAEMAAANPLPAVPEWEAATLSPFSSAKAATLLRQRWSCLGCHALGDDGGRIGPSLDGIAQRLQPSHVRALIADPAHLSPGAVMPASLEQPDRIDLIASYLLGREGEWTGSERLRIDPPPTDLPPPPDDLAATGAALYANRCAPCHGPTGRGDGFNAPFLPATPTAHADSAAMSLRTDDTLYDGIHAGGWILGKSHRMPAFGASLDDGEKRALVAWIRVLCRCQGPAWSRDGRRVGR